MLFLVVAFEIVLNWLNVHYLERDWSLQVVTYINGLDVNKDDRQFLYEYAFNFIKKAEAQQIKPLYAVGDLVEIDKINLINSCWQVKEIKPYLNEKNTYLPLYVLASYDKQYTESRIYDEIFLRPFNALTPEEWFKEKMKQ